MGDIMHVGAASSPSSATRWCSDTSLQLRDRRPHDGRERERHADARRHRPALPRPAPGGRAATGRGESRHASAACGRAGSMVHESHAIWSSPTRDVPGQVALMHYIHGSRPPTATRPRVSASPCQAIDTAASRLEFQLELAARLAGDPTGALVHVGTSSMRLFHDDQRAYRRAWRPRAARRAPRHDARRRPLPDAIRVIGPAILVS